MKQFGVSRLWRHNQQLEDTSNSRVLFMFTVMEQINEEHYRKLERMYLTSKGNTAYYETMTLNISHKKAELTLDISDKYFHALGAIHGSVYFKMLDDAAFFAVNSIVEDAFVLTTSFNINLLRPVSAGKLRAVGQVRFSSRQLFVAEATLYNEAGKEVAFGTGNFAKSKVALSAEIGYKWISFGKHMEIEPIKNPKIFLKEIGIIG